MEIFLYILVGVVIYIAGYATRKYVGKRWPNAEEALDTVAKHYGERAELAVKRARQRQGNGG